MDTISLKDITTLDGLFLTGTSLHVLPVKQVNEIKLNVYDKTMREIMHRFREIVDRSDRVTINQS
jgi:NAD-dependent SIR2 family protein deacetylase